jgi:hypothetical protein
MASDKGAVASGADFDAQATRRRNVPSTAPNGGLVNRVEIDEKKTQAKQVSFLILFADKFPYVRGIQGISPADMYALTEPTIDCTISRRMGVYHCTSDIHNTGILHTIIQDRFVTDCDLG